MKLKTVRKGWRLDSVLSVQVAAAQWFGGKLPFFVASTDAAKGHWDGGKAWESNPIAGPWGLPGVV